MAGHDGDAAIEGDAPASREARDRTARAAVESRLAALGIAFTAHEHPPVATVAEAEQYWGRIEAVHAKNLFLRNARGSRHYLVVLSHDRRADLQALALAYGEPKLGFASPERLLKYLGLTPGSVSPFGLINDPDKHVHVAIDHALKDAATVAFHPNVNTATLVLSGADFRTFLASTGHDVRWI
jgi:Ala-tRNA(Pro) deacylase